MKSFGTRGQNIQTLEACLKLTLEKYSLIAVLITHSKMLFKMFYLYNGLPEDIVNLETIEDLISERFKVYCSPINLHYDTERFHRFDEISHLFMCIIALDCPNFKETFFKGETKIFKERLKRKDYLKLEHGLSAAHHHLSNLSQIEEAKNVKLSQLKWLNLVENIIKTMLDKSAHIFKITHSEKCRKLKLTMPFTFPIKFVAKRQVEVMNGKVSFSCGKWNMVLELVFEYLLKLELLLMEKCQALEYVMYKSEDDRFRQIIRRFTNSLSGTVDIERRVIKAEDVDEEARYFPPCMANLHQILRQTHRLSYASRFQYLLFLKDIGLPVDENVSFWEGEYSKPALGSSCTHEWEEKQKRYTYQVRHLYGLSGCHKLKTSHPCDKFIRDLESKMDGGCPFQHLTENELRNVLPERITLLPDVEDIFKYKSHNLPQRACAVYLKCQRKVSSVRRGDETQINASRIIHVVNKEFAKEKGKKRKMSALQPNRFISFQTNPNRSQHLQAGANGFPQNLSFSGSETDVSTSNENLSHEERYVIRHTARQEPQGQENLAAPSSNRNSLKQGELGSNRSSLDVSTCSYNTLIIHNADESWAGRLSGIRDGNNLSENNSPRHSHVQSDPNKPLVLQKGSNSPSPSLSSGKDRTSYDGSGRLHFDPGVRDITDIPDDYLNQSQVLKHLAKEVKVPPSSLVEESVDPLSEHKRHSLSRRDNPLPEYTGGKFFEGSPSTVLMQRCKNSKRDKAHLSKSQPDLSKVGVGRPKTKGREEFGDGGKRWAEMVNSLAQENSRLKAELESYIQKVAKTQKLEQEISKVHRAQEELVQSSERRGRLEREARNRLQNDCRRLQEMNRTLRDQIEVLSSRLLSSRLPSDDPPDILRKELNSRDIIIAQLITQCKELAASKERQEIELAAQRATLQEQRTHIDILDTALTNAQENVVKLEEECRKKQMYVELVAQLKSALATQQQASNRREQTEHKLRLQLEGELRAERAKNTGTDSSSGLGSSSNGSNSSATLVGESSPELKRKLREREELIMRLEGEVAKWEQRYLEESALRQAAIDAASLPKDAKIAALEKTSQETEKLIAEARSEKIRHMDEVHAAQKKVADLESRVKDLESKLAERDAMIKVLQKHTYDKEVSASYPSIALGRSPHHTPHSSLNADLLGASVSREELGPTAGVFSTVSSVLTSSTGFTSYSGCSDSASKLFHPAAYHPTTSASFNPTTSLSCGDSATKLGYHAGDSSSKLSFGGDSSSKLSFGGDSGSKLSFHGGDSANKMGYTSYRGKFGTNQSFDDTKKSLDDQLKELDSQLDSQLLSKRGLCCFPGFSNPSTTSRKGKIPQPLLAGVVGLENAGGFLGGLVRSDQQGRPEEMLLLEKQGRSSQRQRMAETERAGSLPPSSLPRPRRSRDRKLGEYGRLSDGEATRKASTNSSGSEEHVMNKSTPPRPPAQPKIEYTRFGEVRKQSNDSGKIDFGRFGDSRKTPPLDASNFARFETRKNSGSDGSSKLEYTRLCEPRKTPPLDGQSKLEYNRFCDSRKTPPVESSPKNTVKKSFIPHPRKLGEYGHLSDGKGSSVRTSTDSTPSSRGPRDSAASASGDSGTGVSTSSDQSKVRLFSPSPTRRGSSLSRETPSSGKYRIQF